MDLHKRQAKEQLVKWFESLLDWQKDLFIYLWNGASVQDSVERSKKIIDDKFLKIKFKYTPQTVFPETIDFGNSENSIVQLSKISEIEGVGALSNQNELSFGTGLTVVYGENGCGKSSYVRILKALENPVNSKCIFGNVFTETNISPKANVEFLLDDEIKSIIWNKSSNISYPIQIYDSEVAQQFVEKKQEMIYEPKVLAIITAMATVYEKLNEIYIGKLNGVKELVEYNFKDINNHSLVESFNKLSKEKAIDDFVKAHPWNNDLKEEQEAIAESLKETDFKKSISSKRNQVTTLKMFYKDICNKMDFVSDLECSDYLSKRQNQIDRKSKADIVIEQSKNLSSILSFGSNEWNNMWESCLEYIKLHNENAELPLSRDGLCALCQQKVDGSTYLRLESFEKIKMSDAIEMAEQAFVSFENKVNGLQENIENTIDFKEIQFKLRLAEIDEFIQESILSYYKSISSRCQWLLTSESDDISKLPNLEDRINIEHIFAYKIGKLEAKIKALEDTNYNRDKQVERMQELAAIRCIMDNIDNKKQQIILEMVVSKCKTNTLTTLKKTLSKLLITDTYIAKFQEEMRMLDQSGKIKVELVAAKPEKGRAYHQIVLRGIGSESKHKNGEILSEGEFRVVSLATFLADLSAWSKVMPFVFDDPITSLDHKFENRVAKRLVKLSTERQVVVFTHRLLFAKLLENNINECNAEYMAQNSEKRAKIEQIQLRNDPLGKAQKPSYQNVGMKNALNKMLSEDIPKVKKEQKSGDYSVADYLIQGVASSFRNIVELGVEHELLCGIVMRYKSEISSLKIPCLGALKREDVELFHRMMSRYSNFDHSHSTETVPQLPDINEIESDVKEMLEWAKTYKKRGEKFKDEFEGKLK